MNLSGTWTQLLWRSTMFQSFSWINSWYEKRWNFCRVFLRMWWMPQAFLARRVLVEGRRRTWDVILQGVFLAWSFIQNKDTLYAVRRHASSLITPWLRCSLHYVLALSIFGRRFGSYGQLTRTGPAASAVEWRQFGWHFSESWGAMFPRETSWCFAVGTLYPRLAGWLRCSWDSGGVLYRGQWRAGRDAVVTILHPKNGILIPINSYIPLQPAILEYFKQVQELVFAESSSKRTFTGPRILVSASRRSLDEFASMSCNGQCMLISCH